MSFFSRKVECDVCGGEAGLNRNRIADKKWMCSSCMKKAGLRMWDGVDKMTVEDIRAAMQSKESNQNELENFNPTKTIGTYMEFDDTQEKWLVLSAILGKRNKSTVYNYSDIVDFELLEDGESVAGGGLGRALVGGALFGGTGAIVGGITGKRKSKNVCNSLKLKITINDFNNPTVYVKFVDAPMKRNGLLFKSTYKHAQECLSTLQLICDRQKSNDTTKNNSASDADELLKFKQLLDAGAITPEEYDAKKKEILGL